MDKQKRERQPIKPPHCIFQLICISMFKPQGPEGVIEGGKTHLISPGLLQATNTRQCSFGYTLCVLGLCKHTFSHR